jgi:predicted esterase
MKIAESDLKIPRWRIFAIVFASVLVMPVALRAGAPDAMISFDAAAQIAQADSHIQVNLDPAAEKFFVHVPANYDGSAAFGLIVYIDAQDQSNAVPTGWDRVLEQKKLLFVAPQNAGNNQPINRRSGLGLLAVRGMEQKYKVDTGRVYASGYSGGAREASHLGFYAPDVFAGTIQCCGTDFYHAVPQVDSKSQVETAGEPYGLLDATPQEVDAAKQHVHFVLITGANDFRGGNIRDIFHGGFEKEGFTAKLIDVPGMAHNVCPPHALIEALNFIENNGPEPTTQPGAPPWMARDPAHWPQILLADEMNFADNTRLLGASAFLMRLPGGAVVGATAKHVVGEVTLSDLKSRMRTWAVVRPKSPSDRVMLTQWAEKMPEADALDWVVMAPASQAGPWPAQPLPARTDPVEVGETVYLLAVPDGDPATQKVYKGTVTEVNPKGEFAYVLSEVPNSHGFSGAPIIDVRGQLAGMHVAHFETPGKYAGLSVAMILPLIQPPPGAAPAAPSEPTVSSAEQSQTDPADAALRRAQLLIQNKVYDKAKQKLQSIIDAYPDTPAAEKAAQLLADLQNK